MEKLKPVEGGRQQLRIVDIEVEQRVEIEEGLTEINRVLLHHLGCLDGDTVGRHRVWQLLRMQVVGLWLVGVRNLLAWSAG